MGSDDNGADRLIGDDASTFAGEAFSISDRVIRADIAWQGGGAKSASASKLRRASASRRNGLPDSVIVGSSPRARALRERIRLYADDLSPVLISGETGAGKELVARELHRFSARGSEAFVPLNAGAIPEALAASELFGHVRGAFTSAVGDRDGAFQAADGGVLFIDEIGDMPASIQAQLLRVLDDGVVTKVGARSGATVDIRLVAASNVDLRKSVATGAFRRDLFHRVAVLQIDVPALRERGDDVIEIAEDIIAAHPNAEFRAARLTPIAADRLKAHAFPGNVRELKNVIARALVHARGGRILAEHLVFAETCGTALEPSSLDISEAKELIERLVVLKALRQTNGNVTRAAALTGRTRSTFHMLKKQLEGGDFTAEYDAVCARVKALIDAS